MKDIKVFVAVHKEAPLYGDDAYQFVHVGAANSSLNIDGAIKDNECEDNISNKNGYYCELTGVYHIWKNIKDVEYVGLCHYRRFLAHKRFCNNPNKVILHKKEILDLLKDKDILLPNRLEKKYSGFISDLEILKKCRPYKLMLAAIQELYPEWVEDFNIEMSQPTMSFENIMICKKVLFDDYCQWLFAVLSKIEDNLKKNNDQMESREMGLLSEYLLNVWVRHKKLKTVTRPVYLVTNTKNWHYQTKLFLQNIGLSKLELSIEHLVTKIKRGI